MSLTVAVKENANGILLVITDSKLLGKVFEEGKVQLDLSKTFYQGEEKSQERVKKLLEKARYVHLTGKEAVQLGVELRIVDKDRILQVQGIPHAEVLLD